MNTEILQVLEQENWLYVKISRLLPLLHPMSCVMWSIRFNHSFLALRFFADFGNNNSIIIFSCSICRWLCIRQSCLVARHDQRTRKPPSPPARALAHTGEGREGKGRHLGCSSQVPFTMFKYLYCSPFLTTTHPTKCRVSHSFTVSSSQLVCKPHDS
jgi:hypothetical protein